MPLPLSATMMQASLSSASSDTVIWPPWAVYLAALFNRFTTTCTSRVLSPRTAVGAVLRLTCRRCWRASIRGRACSTALWITSFKSSSDFSISTSPRVTRDTSSRSSTRSVRWRTWRWMISPDFLTRAGSLWPSISSWAALLIVDVGAGAHPADDGAGVVAHGQGAAQHPAIGAAVVAQAVLDFVGLAGSEAGLPGGARALLVVRMKNAVPAVAVRAPARHARENVPLGVVVVVEAVGQGGPDHLRQRVGDGAELGGALAQRGHALQAARAAGGGRLRFKVQHQGHATVAAIDGVHRGALPGAASGEQLDGARLAGGQHVFQSGAQGVRLGEQLQQAGAAPIRRQRQQIARGAVGGGEVQAGREREHRRARLFEQMGEIGCGGGRVGLVSHQVR